MQVQKGDDFMENKNLIDKAIGFIQKTLKTICRCKALRKTQDFHSPILIQYSDSIPAIALWNTLAFTSSREARLNFAEHPKQYLKLRLISATPVLRASPVLSKIFTVLHRVNTVKSIWMKQLLGMIFPVKLQSAVSDEHFLN